MTNLNLYSNHLSRFWRGIDFNCLFGPGSLLSLPSLQTLIFWTHEKGNQSSLHKPWFLLTNDKSLSKHNGRQPLCCTLEFLPLLYYKKEYLKRSSNLIGNYDTYFGQKLNQFKFKWKWKPLSDLIFIKPWSNFESLFVMCYFGKVFNANIL